MKKIDNPQLYDNVIYTISKILEEGRENPTPNAISKYLDIDLLEINKTIKSLEGRGYLQTKSYLYHHFLTEKGKNFVLTESHFEDIVKEQSLDKSSREKQNAFFASSLEKLEIEIQEIKDRLSPDNKKRERKKDKEQSDFHISSTKKNNWTRFIALAALLVSAISVLIQILIYKNII